MKNQKYYLGLDIGSNSVGFCVTDQDYNIIKKHKVVYDGENTKYYGNHLWGARLFDDASDASSRRMARENRRRLQRRRWRIILLQNIFKEEMDKVDPYFFDRLNNSAIHLEDRDEVLRKDNLLFNDKDKNDSQFYHNYPTIYHLRKEMIENPEIKFDIREIYLALAHMIKYRGNFLTEGEMSSIGNDPQTIVDIFNEIDSTFDEINQNDSTYSKFNCTLDIANELIKKFKKLNKISEITDALKAAFKLTGASKSDFRIYAFSVISGSKVAFTKMFTDVEDNEDLKKISIEFGSENFLTETLPNASNYIGDERTRILLKLKELYDLRILVNLLKGEQYISNSMVEIYDKHKEQLKILKDLVKRYNPKEYNNFFRKIYAKDGKALLTNYANYIGYNDFNGKRIRTNKSNSQENLYKQIKNILRLGEACKDGFVELENGDKEKLLEIKNLIESNTYLLKQNSKDNGVLPYQLNLLEMHKILENQSQYYPFLAEMDKDFNNPEKQCYKIESILKFKIPYFVGPLSNKTKSPSGKNNYWMERKTDDKITPWNFHDVVDEEKTAENFMNNLKNYCTYLINEPTLPKDSLLNQFFILLNEMNKWKLNDSNISVEDKEYIVKEVYFKVKKPTVKIIKEALKRKYGTDIEITTTGSDGEKNLINEDLHATLSSWIYLMDDRAFGNSLLKDLKTQELAEDIIYEIATFENKDLVVKKLTKHNLAPRQIKYISSLKFDGWARLSKKLLNGIYTEEANIDTGEAINTSIMDIMWRSNENFMQILTTKNDNGKYKYDFMKVVEELNNIGNETIDDIISSTYASPIMKRALHQTVKVVEELKNILKIDQFDAYYIESTREEGEKRRTKSRKDSISEMLDTATSLFKNEVDNLKYVNEIKSELDDRNESELKGKKLYLYFMQLGKSVYSGERIDLSNLKDYDIDHIIPQSTIKDDSFINTVLVEKGLNNKKSDTYPISKDILSDKGKAHIKFLSRFNNAFMPKEKMKRLLRAVSNPLTDQELSGFIQRQLVTTNQSVKAVCDVLKKIDKDADIIYSRAGLVSEFRKVFNIPKSRDINDFHHAHDAYLNVVVGNVYYKRFSSGNPDIIKYMREHFESYNTSLEYLFKNDQRILYKDTLIWKAKKYVKKDGQISWRGDKEVEDSQGTIDKVRKYLSYQDVLVTHRMYQNVGKQGFFNKISLHKAADADASYPLKTTGPLSQNGFESKYGGYSDLTNPYACLVKSDDKKGKHIYSLEFIPTIFRVTVKNDKSKLEEYLAKNNKLKNPEILIEKLMMGTILQIPYTATNGKKGYARIGISGKSGNSAICVNYSEPHFANKYILIIKKISKLLGTNNQANEKVDLTIYDKFGMGDIDCTRGKVTRDELKKLFNYIVDEVYTKPQYEGLPSLGCNFIKIKEVRLNFEKLKTLEQLTFISTLLRLILCKSSRGNDLRCLDNKLPSTCGIIMLGKNLNPGVKIIQTSVTGLVERVLFTVPEE